MKRIKTLCLICLFGLIGFTAQAQSEVTSTSLLYNAPYRHYINPAFEPITEGYLTMPILSHLSLYAGNNSLSLSDLIINNNGKSMWTLNPNSGVDFMSAFRENTLVNANLNMALLGFGWRTSHNGYLHFNLNERLDAGVTLPKDLFKFVLGGGMTDLDNGNSFNLSSLGVQAQLFTELSAGYSRTSGEIWTWGFKLKALAGHAYLGAKNNDLNLYASPESWALQGSGSIRMAAPLKTLPTDMSGETLFGDNKFDWQGNMALTDVKSYFNGWGGAIDLGLSVKPVKYVTISLAVTDLGCIYWNRGKQYNYTIDGEFEGMGQMDFNDYTDSEGKFDSQRFGDTLAVRLKNVYQTALTSQPGTDGFWVPLTMKINASVEANLANDMIGLGVYSKTMYYNSRFFEEVTLGASIRPVSWFNLGVSYSFLNGKWSNVGAGLGLRLGPFIISLAADYVPITYAAYNGKSFLPYKTNGMNFEMGLGIVWGWKKKAAPAAPAIQTSAN